MQTSIDFVKSVGVDYVEFHIMVIIPGTPLFDRAVAEGKVPADVFDRFMLGEVNYPEYSPGDITPQEMRNTHQRALREFYFRPGYFALALQRLQRRPSDIVQYAKTARSLMDRAQMSRPIWALGRKRLGG